MAGPIAQEVVDELTKSPLPVRPVEEFTVRPKPQETWQTSPAPGSPPTQVTATNIPKPYTAAWWFEKGGTTGIICFLLVIAFGWLGNSQREGQNALIGQMQVTEKNRAAEMNRVVDGILRTQESMLTELRNMTAAIQKKGEVDR